MSSFVLKLKCKSGQEIVRGLNGQSTLGELKEKLSSLTNIKPKDLHVLYGYPPKPLKLIDDDLTLEKSSINSGEILIVEEKESPSPTQERQNESKRTNSDPAPNENVETQGILLRKVVPADNSCLFTSIGYVLSGKVQSDNGVYLRDVIAESVAADPEVYSEAILGKPNAEYCEWIKRSESWGGAIELAVLSKFYGIEIDVVDTLNCIINRFGEDQKYGQRVLLIFDGIHYDPLYLEPIQGGKIQTIFPILDESILSQALALSEEAKSSRQFTDLARFTLKCMVCHVMLTGQVQAQQHAKETGHKSFGCFSLRRYSLLWRISIQRQLKKQEWLNNSKLTRHSAMWPKLCDKRSGSQETNPGVLISEYEILDIPENCVSKYQQILIIFSALVDIEASALVKLRYLGH